MPTVLLYNTQKKHTQQISQFFSLSLVHFIASYRYVTSAVITVCAHSFSFWPSASIPFYVQFQKRRQFDMQTVHLLKWKKLIHSIPYQKKKKDLNTRTLLAKNLIIDKATTNLTLILYTLQSPIIEWWSHRWYYHEIIGQLKEMISSKEHIIIYHANTLIVHCAFITNVWLSSYHWIGNDCFLSNIALNSSD